jgi:hypothetical protein
LTATDDRTQEREEELIHELLHERAGIDPDRVGPLLDLAAIGLVNSAWRNTCVEDWHAGGRLRDGDMLRINSHTTLRARQLMRRWMSEAGMSAGASLSALDGISAEDVRWLVVVRLYRWLTNPARKLPTGVMLAQIAADGLPEYEDDADECLTVVCHEHGTT